MERHDPRLRDTRPGRLAAPARVLVVSSSSARRRALAAGLEDDGFAVLDAATAEETLWCLVAERSSGGRGIDLIVADAATPDLLPLLEDVAAGPSPPALVLVGAARVKERLGAAHVVDDRLPAVSAAVERALKARRQPPEPGPLRVAVALADAARRDALVSLLVRRGGGVIQVDDGLELLELLGRQVTQPDGWYPAVAVLDARLPRMDGLDALAEVRQFDRTLRAVVLVEADDAAAREAVVGLAPADAVERVSAPAALADRVLQRRRQGDTTQLTRCRV